MNKQMSDAQQKEYLTQVRSQIQVQMMQEMMTKMSENCFKVCTSTRGNGLDNNEKYCLSNCIDRYADTLNVVSQTLGARQNG